jgi:hypothetical protein
MLTFFDKFRNSLIVFLKKVLLTDKIYFSLIIIFVSTSSFFLGRMSKIFETKPIFTQTAILSENYALSEKDVLENSIIQSTSTIMASKKGKKYYFVWCKYAESIKPENRIYFNTEEEAIKRGLTLASNCK